MFWHKIHHHLSFFFLAILVLAQGLIFVVSKANPQASYDFKIVFINPLGQSSHQLGEQISLQAQLNKQGIDDKTAVYLVVASPEKNIRLNFEASRAQDGTWQANNIWDTTDWPAGIYQLSAVVNIFDKNSQLVDTWYSDVNLVQLLDLSLEKPVAVVSKESEQPIAISQIDIEKNQIAKSSSATIEIAPDVIEDIGDESLATSTIEQPDTQVIERHISLVAPVNNSTISKAQLSLRLTTNFAADGLNIELINADSAAISTGILNIDKVDGLNWNKTINLDDTFIAGNYKLLATAVVPSSETVLENTFDLRLALPITLNPTDVVLTLANPGNNLSGPVTIKVTSNKNLNNLKFIFQESVEKKEVLQVDGVLQTSTAGGGQQYIYLLDTTQLANGTYYLIARSLVGDTKVSGEAKIISIYNEAPVLAVSTSTRALATSTDPLLDLPTTDKAELTVGNIDCQKSGIIDQQLCAKYQAEVAGQIPSACLGQNIFTADACEQYLRDNKVQSICQNQGLTDLTQCQDYLASQYLAKVDCQTMATSTCQTILRQKYLYRLSLAQGEQAKINQLTDAKAGQTIKLQDLMQELAVSEEFSWQSPLLKMETNVLIAKASSTTILANADQLLLNNPIVLLLDRDADLLSDDLEAYYGTDSANPDTDGDGYLDGDEIKNGYNPAGTGKLEIVRNALDQALWAKLSLEQPHEASLLIDPVWQLKQAITESAGLTLSGTADPGTWINIYLYSSLPLLLATKTDSSGVWNYQLNQTLTEGLHKVYIASNDSDGKLLKQSDSISFVVTNISKEPALVDNTPTQAVPVVKNFWQKLPFNIYYVGGGFFLIIFILGIILLLRRSRKIAANAIAENTIAETPAETSAPVDGAGNPQV